MTNAILGTKLDMVQKFDKAGWRMPVSQVMAGPCKVAKIKTLGKDGYNAIQFGFGEKKVKPKKGAKSKTAPKFLREFRVDKLPRLKIGDEIKVGQVFKVGDKVKVTGQSKGKGFTGVMKRWGFKGGPRTHGQSDRQRAPGSIGQGTTPGRVYKGKKMPGRAGGQKVTISGLTVTEVDDKNNLLEIKGLLPGPKNGFLIIRKQNA
ncbi:MAG TPA: 50S ribosomal protein L3 [Nevskiaceae bacterium]|nr:50S ribosomal protein L3 [Nevskiaceae bacterium]